MKVLDASAFISTKRSSQRRTIHGEQHLNELLNCFGDENNHSPDDGIFSPEIGGTVEQRTRSSRHKDAVISKSIDNNNEQTRLTRTMSEKDAIKQKRAAFAELQSELSRRKSRQSIKHTEQGPSRPTLKDLKIVVERLTYDGLEEEKSDEDDSVVIAPVRMSRRNAISKAMSPIKASKAVNVVETKQKWHQKVDAQVLTRDGLEESDNEVPASPVRPSAYSKHLPTSINSAPFQKKNFLPKEKGTVYAPKNEASNSRGRPRLKLASKAVTEDEIKNILSRLHPSCIPENLACRETEFDAVYRFIACNLREQRGGCLYVNGVPGTGKTAIVCRVMKELQKDNSIPTFQLIEVNGMKLLEPHQMFAEVLRLNVKKRKKGPLNAAAELAEYFMSGVAKKRQPIVLIVDELDLLWTKRQDVLYQLFDWPSTSNLCVIAIANTMDLPERMMMNRVSSRLGMERLCFQPYNYNQLIEIIRRRVGCSEVMDEDAVEYVARKVAAFNGDLRRALDICRTAIEKLLHTNNVPLLPSPSKKQKAVDSLAGAGRTIGMSDMESAFKQVFTCVKMKALRLSSVVEELFLRAAVAEYRRSGLELMTLSAIISKFDTLCKLEGLSTPCYDEVAATCEQLCNCRLIVCEPDRNDIWRKIRLNVPPADILFALCAAKSD